LDPTKIYLLEDDFKLLKSVDELNTADDGNSEMAQVRPSISTLLAFSTSEFKLKIAHGIRMRITIIGNNGLLSAAGFQRFNRVGANIQNYIRSL